MPVATSTHHLTRKLSDAETSKLRSILTTELASKNADNENITDLLDFVFAMAGNGKTVQYIVDELVSMEMEECDAGKAKDLGDRLIEFIVSTEKTEKESQADEKDKPQIVSFTKSSSSTEGNALTKAGALGTNKVKKKERAKVNTKINNDGAKKENNNTKSKISPKPQLTRNNNNKNSNNQRGDNHVVRRSITSETFNRLVQKKTEHGRGSRNNTHNVNGRGGTERGRQGNKGRGHNNNTNNRGRGNGGRGAGGKTSDSYSKRPRETELEEDFIPAGRGNSGGRAVGYPRGPRGPELGSKAAGRGGMGGRNNANSWSRNPHDQGRGSRGGRMSNNGTAGGRTSAQKKPRIIVPQNENVGFEGADMSYGEENYNDPNVNHVSYEEHEYHNGDGYFDNSYFIGNPPFGRGRGGRGFRGGRATGRGLAGRAHPSPLIASSFTIASSFGGQPGTGEDQPTYNPLESGYTGRGGRGRGFYRGSGRGRTTIPGRSTVANMIASKVWVRPRTMEDSLATKR